MQYTIFLLLAPISLAISIGAGSTFWFTLPTVLAPDDVSD
jgi:hypothetical protein